MEEKYYTAEQVSELLRMHPKTIQRYIREGKLGAVKIGKGWRISGHDLSVFTESVRSRRTEDGKAAARKVTASSVVDIEVGGREEAVRIMNTLTATMHSKPRDCGESSLQTQYIEAENRVRVTLWGSAAVVETMLAAIVSLTQPEETQEV